MNILEILQDQINSTEVNLTNIVFRLLLSMVLGVMVGAERKRKGQIAGVRTFALISMGACLSMLLSIYVPQVYLGLKNGDPGRIAAQVITGVGFLGGGAMIHMKGSVRGLTTAAGIWVIAIIGMAVGMGMYWASILSTIFILLVLKAFEAVEQKAHMGQENRSVRITVKGIVDDLKPYLDTLTEHGVHVSTYFVKYDYDGDTTDIQFIIMAPSHHDYMSVLAALRKIGVTNSLTLTTQA